MKKQSPSAPDLELVQRVRKLVLLAALLIAAGFVAVAASRWESGTLAHETIEWIGIGLIIFCIVGRTWSSFYIGGRKTKELVQFGPYSISRNPLYVFTFIGSAGVGAQLGSAVIAGLAAVIAWAVFSIVVQKEEQALLVKFGAPYRRYRDRVPRFFPAFGLWRDLETVEVRPKIIRSTFFDACVFLLSIPLAEFFEYLQHSGVLPVLLRLP